MVDSVCPAIFKSGSMRIGIGIKIPFGVENRQRGIQIAFGRNMTHIIQYIRSLNGLEVPLYQFGKGHFGAYFDMELTWT